MAVSAATAKPIDVAYLVLEKDAAAIVEPLRGALSSRDPLVRTTAARVAGVRDEKRLVADLRRASEHESDATAAREELRSIALLGTPDDVDYALAAAAKWPVSVKGSVEWMIAGRPDALDLYFSKLRGDPGVSRAFFTKALWGRSDASAVTSRLAGLSDAAGWRAYLSALRESHVPLPPEPAALVLNSTSEEMRNETVWYYVRSFAKNPDELPRSVRDAFAAPQQTASDREAFGRELARRMLGDEKKEDPRWLAWLETKEADDLLAYNEPDVFALLTDREFALRKNHCGILPVECTMPSAKPIKVTGHSFVVPHPVRQPEIALPDALPAGLAGAIASQCPDAWFGLASVSVDGAGRVQDVDLSHIQTKCSREVETLLRLSYATNLSIASPRTASDILLSRAPRTTPCLDEEPPDNEVAAGLAYAEGKVVAPKMRHRVNPVFPAALRGGESPSGNIVIIEAIISKTGCVRSVRLVAQSPFPEFNTSAVYAVSQWTFYPGTLDGKPVDVIYNLTINFRR